MSHLSQTMSQALSPKREVWFVKAKGRRLLDEAVRRARGLDALDAHRANKPRDKAAIQEFLTRYDPKPREVPDDEVRGGSPLEGIPLPDYVPPTWTVEWVATRLVRAWQHAGWGSGPVEGGKSGFWPDYHHTWGDMMGWEEGDFRARPLEKWAGQRPQRTAAEIRQIEEATRWPLRFLRDHEREALALRTWLGSKVTRSVKVGRECKKHKWSRSMYNRAYKAALERIAAGLNAAGDVVT